MITQVGDCNEELEEVSAVATPNKLCATTPPTTRPVKNSSGRTLLFLKSAFASSPLIPATRPDPISNIVADNPINRPPIMGLMYAIMVIPLAIL